VEYWALKGLLLHIGGEKAAARLAGTPA